MNAIVSALRFFFTRTFDRPGLARKLVRTRLVRKLPVVPSLEEVARLLATTMCLKRQTVLSVDNAWRLTHARCLSRGDQNCSFKGGSPHCNNSLT